MSQCDNGAAGFASLFITLAHYLTNLDIFKKNTIFVV